MYATDAKNVKNIEIYSMLLGAVIIYLIITVVIGLVASRWVKNANDYVSAGRKIPFALSTAALFALWFGSETVLGASSAFAENGLIGVIEDPFGGVLCLLIYAFIFAKPLYKMNLITLGDLFKIRYGKNIELLSAVFMVLTFFGYIAAQLVALGIVLSMISGISISNSIIICTTVVTLYTMAGGMWAVSLTDFIQSILIVVGLIVVTIAITNSAGGVSNILDAAPVNSFQFFPDNHLKDWAQWIGAWTILGLGSLPSQDIFQRVNSNSTENKAVSSTVLAAIIYGIIAMVPLYLGLAAKVLYANELQQTDTQQFLPFMILKHANVYVQILFFGALLSAIFSTASGAILAPATIIAENIIKPLRKSPLSDKHFLLIIRICVCGMALLSMLMALQRSNIYELVGEAYILGLVTLTVPMFCAVYYKKATAYGAGCAMILGITTWFIFEHILHFDLPNMLIGLAASIIGMVLGNLIKKY